MTRKMATQTKLAEFVRLLQEKGPEIASIARELGEHEETVRYWYKEKLLKKGFTINAAVNHARLGLRRIVVLAKVEDVYLPAMRQIGGFLAENAYVVGYSCSMPDQVYVIHSSVPNRYVEEYYDFIVRLKEIGLLKEVQGIYSFDWFGNIPMRVGSYDFDSDRWEVDLGDKVKSEPSEILAIKEKRIDAVDVQIVELEQSDANLSVTEIATRIGLNYRRTLRHYKHVQIHGLISFFRINWMGTGYRPDLGKPLTARHRYLAFQMYLKGISEPEQLELRSGLRKLPFLWAEAGGDNYFCELFIPLDYTNEVLSYLKSLSTPLAERARWFITDYADAYAYSIPAQLYDERKGWLFNPSEVLARLESFLLTAKQHRKTGVQVHSEIT